MALEEWERREWAKLKTGHYTAVPWSTEEWWTAIVKNRDDPRSKFWVHVSTANPALIAFTANEAHGVANRQTALKPGRFLTREFSDVLPPQMIAHYASLFTAASTELKFATTPDDIHKVYRDGPRSCMSYPDSEYESPIHPVKVYGAGDLAVAYITDEDGHCTARALVWPAKKRMQKVYGDGSKLLTLLQEAGYSWGGFAGAKLLHHPTDRGPVVPYLDGDDTSVDVLDRRYLVIGENGEHSCRETTGFPSEAGEQCDGCGERMTEEESHWAECDEQSYCSSCDERYRIFCDRCETTSASEGSSTVNANGREQTWCEYCTDHDAGSCNDCGEIFDRDNLAPDIHDELLCNDCSENLETCRDTGNYIPADETCDCLACEEAREEDLDPPSPTVDDPNQIELPLQEVVEKPSGLSEDCRQQCSRCNVRVSEDSATYSEVYDGIYCSECFGDAHDFCEHCHTCVMTGCTQEVYVGQRGKIENWCRYCRLDNAAAGS